MTGYHRTKIAELLVQGYRSLKYLHLTDIPDLVVLHGLNGVGKSNILQAIRLILRWSCQPDFQPTAYDEARSVGFDHALQFYDIQPDDFARGHLPEIRIYLRLELGSRCQSLLGPNFPHELRLHGVVQDQGGQFRLWFDEARLGDLSLTELLSPDRNQLREEIKKLYEQEIYINTQLRDEELRLGQRETDSERIGSSNTIEQHKQKKRELREIIRQKEGSISQEELVLVRVRSLLLPTILHHIKAYRTGKGDQVHIYHPSNDRSIRESEIQSHLLSSFIAYEPERRQTVRQLAGQLSKAGLSIKGLWPVWHPKLKEAQLLLDTPQHGEMSLSMMGTGTQQLVWMVASMFLNASPILQMEEPEAHLHSQRMIPLAHYLQQAVTPTSGDPVIDQLWLETHHHAFAISPYYLDVSMDYDGWTQAAMTKRSQAIKHFYEPGPFWEALRQLVDSALNDDTVVFRDASGLAITASMVKDSIEGDRILANEYAQAMTDAAVLALRRNAKQQDRI